MLWKALKTVRFWKWWLGISVFGVALWFIPKDIQVAMCTLYEQTFSQAVEDALRVVIDPSTATSPASGDSPSSSAPSNSVSGTSSTGFTQITAESAAEQIRKLICLRGFENAETTDSRWIEATTATLPVSFGVALMICLIIPGRTNQAEDRGEDELPPVVDGPTVAVNRAGLSQMLQDRQVLAGRARQLRVALIYALLSGTFTAFKPPSFTTEDFWGSAQNRAHMLALGAAACISAAWGAHSLARSKREAMAIAAAVGWGGVFIGSLIALSIALPYRLVTPIEAVRLHTNDAARFALVRLGFLPLLAGIGSLAWVVAHRAYRKRDLNIMPRRGNQ